MNRMEIEEAYERYVDVVYRFFYIKCLDRSTAEDLTSKTFLSVVERLQLDEPGIGDMKKFIYGIMRRVWLMYLRDKYRRHEQDTEDIDEFSGYVESTVADYEADDIRQRAEKYIRQLPEQQRRIVSMRLLEEVSIKDIASEIGKDRNYVKTTYKRGLKRLKELAAGAVIEEGRI